MRKKQRHVISKVLPGSIAEELELEPGDVIKEINGNIVEDVFDYHYLMNDEYVLLLVEKKNGEEWELEVEKEFEEDLGVEFENSLMDDYRSCSNKCIFCFIDQMPPGMRETLYFKDDDTRLSFLQGNYVTLTNMSDHDIDRIIKYHLEPMNISFQTMNPELRCRMLHNRFAGKALEKAQKLYEAGISMNGQIVLCKGFNDKEELEYSLTKLSEYVPVLKSVSIVPVGLSKFREGLEPLEPFTKQDARELIAQVEHWQKKMKELHGIHVVHASDEWYLLAELPLPEEERYDGYQQLENGVGMMTLLKTEVQEELKLREGDERRRNITIATGHLAGPLIQELAEMIREKYPNVHTEVKRITNHYFGERITVAGLITGTDLKEQLLGLNLGEELLLPCCMLRSGENVFLDDITVEQLEDTLKQTIQIVDVQGKDFVKAVLGEAGAGNKKRRQQYEQTDSSCCGQT